jgi:PhnB protein
MTETTTMGAARGVRPIPEGYHSLTPGLVVDNAAEAIEFYKRAFGAQELGRMASPEGQIWHAELQIGDSRLMLGDEFPDMGAPSPKSLGGTTSSIHLYVEDADAVFQRAIEAGATASMPLENAFWGDRYGQVIDPYGHRWGIATRQEEVSDEEMQRRAQAQAAQAAQSA